MTVAHCTHLQGFSASLSDFLIGDPAGLQGEIEVQFGRSALAPNTFEFRQGDEDVSSGFSFDNGTLEIKARANEEVSLTANITNVPNDFEAEFKFPNQTITGTSATGLVKHGDVLLITPIEVVDEERIRKPSFTVRMIASGAAPKLSVSIDGTVLENVVEINGPLEKIKDISVTATPEPADAEIQFNWSNKGLGLDHDGAILSLDSIPSSAQNSHHIVVTERGVDSDSDQRQAC